jgi:putative ATPase
MNLANALRPKTLDEFVGQSHILSQDKALYKLIVKGDIPHLFFYGAPGTGKTTLAKIIAKTSSFDFYYFNATSVKIDELRVVFKKHNNTLIKPLIFIDEVHRLSKTQQEVLLPVMEDCSVVIIGASSENPFFTLTNAIRSRSFLYELKPLKKQELKKILKTATKYLDIALDIKSEKYLINIATGDSRAMLNLLDFAFKIDKKITIKTLKQLRNTSISNGANSKEKHYDTISALIKSLRGSDIDSSIYYLALLLDGGESIDFIARRLVIFSSEDIGNANPNALNLATNCMIAVNKIGFFESRIILSQCVIYLASSPKSNSCYKAINKALSQIKNGKILPIPSYLKSGAKNYKNPHNFGGWCDQNYINENLGLYNSNKIGFEKTLDEWINKIKRI